ncbi:MAG: anthranilate phosphoribosyltransferase [Acidimicrobiia bacterium]
MNIDEINELLAHKNNLTTNQASYAMDEILNGRLNDQQLGLFITLLHAKGETVQELSSLVKTMWANSPQIDDVDVSHSLDTCGTGGDNSGTFNISTAVAILLSAAGVKIAKHGNRAASSKCGAADVLESLNIKVDLDVNATEEMFKQTGFTFLFAPTFHPGMRHAAPVRKALGTVTTFNFLGPLANPYKAPYRMHGISNEKMLRTYIDTIKELDVKAAYVFHGHGGLDEISTSGETRGYQLSDGVITERVIDPLEYGFEPALVEYLVGGDSEHNAEIIRSIYRGDKGPKRDIVLLNAAVGYDLVNNVGVGPAIEMLSKLLDNGEVEKHLEKISQLSNALYK